MISAEQNSTMSQKNIIKSSEYLSKKKFDINRMRLTVGDAKGLALSDKRTLLTKIF